MAKVSEESPISLNAQLNLWSADGKVQFDKDKEAARQFFLQVVNPRTTFFHDLEEKLRYLFDNGYYEKPIWDQYEFADVKALYKKVYDKKHRFESYFSAFKFFEQYAMKSFDGESWLERYEDRVVANALMLGRGDVEKANYIAEEIVEGRLQPATPTFSNAGKVARGEYVSCFLLRIEDNMESIGRGINSALQLSKRGGGVALLLSNIREFGAPIKGIHNASSGVIPVMKLLEDSFSYANQLGTRQGAGAVYLNAFHPDIMRFLDTKRENADEKIRIKTLSTGVVFPDILFELAKNNEDMYLFSPYDVERVYGKPFADISITEKYREMVNDSRIRKYKPKSGGREINAREFFTEIAELQFESGYPYVLFEDNANKDHAIAGGRINMSNLCTEILQVNTPSVFNNDLSYEQVGRDISCNLASLNVAKAMEGGNLRQTVETAINALTSVSDISNIDSVPSVVNGNDMSHSVGLGQMNLHGFFIKEGMAYGDENSLDFTNIYFMTVAYEALRASMRIAKRVGKTFEGFEQSKYADPFYLHDKYVLNPELIKPNANTSAIFAKYGIGIPTAGDWAELAGQIAMHGLYNAYLQAIPPTGSISYINYATSSIHPVAAAVEARKEGKTGRVYFPQPYVTNENFASVEDAYQVGWQRTIDVYAAATPHVDQGLSLTLFYPDTATTKDINKAQIYAWKKGIKTLYYARIRQQALAGTEQQECVSCSL